MNNEYISKNMTAKFVTIVPASILGLNSCLDIKYHYNHIPLLIKTSITTMSAFEVSNRIRFSGKQIMKY